MKPDLESPWDTIQHHVEGVTGLRGRLTRLGVVGGGDINRTERIDLAGTRFFVKLSAARRAGMFEAEAQGLAELAASGTLRVPAPICHGRDETTAFLILEYLELTARGDSAALGKGLASMHGVTREHFGWHRDNTIGATPQINTMTPDWTEFWGRYRLGYQLERAAARGHAGRLQSSGARLLSALPRLLADRRPRAALLHGDLWGGNYAFTPSGEPVIFDPAVYFGDRETDLAMTELFGGFDREFRAAYADRLPLKPGYRIRRVLYQLYHVLNHLNLFGGAYRAQAQSMIDRLLAETG